MQIIQRFEYLRLTSHAVSTAGITRRARAITNKVLQGAITIDCSHYQHKRVEAGGKVEKLLVLSGLTGYQFRKKLNEEFGANPKQWLTEKMTNRILHLAKVPTQPPQRLPTRYTCRRLSFSSSAVNISTAPPQNS